MFLCFIFFTNVWLLKVDFPGLDGYGGPMYIGSGCFHRRKTLCGLKYSEAHGNLKYDERKNVEESASSLELRAKNLITCAFEDNTEWGKEVRSCHISTILILSCISCSFNKKLH
jgi:hypothetical protein